MADTPQMSLTPEQYQQFFAGVLKACYETFDIWVARAKQLYPEAGDAAAVRMAQQQVASMLNTAMPGMGEKSDAMPFLLGDPSACLSQYNACLAGGGSQSYCYSQYLNCLGHRPELHAADNESVACPLHLNAE